MEKCIENNIPLITPVFLKDNNYDRESDYFMCGEKILVCPVFDEGINKISVLLPEGSGSFRLRGEGKAYKAGTSVNVSCTINDLPIWFVEENI